MTSHLTRFRFAFIGAFLVSLLSFANPSASQAAVTVTGYDHENGVSAGPVAVYHWTLQEDVTVHVVPGVPPAPGTAGQAGGFHPSHFPVIASGTFTGDPAAPGTVSEDPASAIATAQAANPDAHYFISILPATEFNQGGAQIAPGQADVEINVNKLPIPTAQIRILVFEDTSPINGAPDTGEPGLAGFEILVEEAGGKYGINAGQVLVDAFGNPIGSTYLPNGDLDVIGSGRVFTDADGVLIIKHLPPAKYGIKVVPPLGQGYSETSTIEGTATQDAWVLANEPSFFTEFGPPGPHVFVGFVKSFDNLATLDTSGGTVTITGTVANLHTSRQPDPTFYTTEAFAHDNCFVGLNHALGGAIGEGPAIYSAPCDKDGVGVDAINLNTFTIPGVPAGSYQLVIWSQFLDSIIAYRNIDVGIDPVTPNGLECLSQPNKSCDLQDVGVFNWFGRMENEVFLDTNQNGFRDEGEINLEAEVATNLRFRDGSVYQSIPTDGGGAAPYDIVFPFFHWFILEVDYGLPLKATGATFTVDAGGPVLPGELLNPQPQFSDGDTTPLINPNTGDNLSRTETGVILTEGFQSFLGTTNISLFGKVPYQGNENGGITGIVFYGVTRAENDPRFGAGEPWEPGIPRVQVNLYEDTLDTSSFPFQATGVIKDQSDFNDPSDLTLNPFPNGDGDIDRNGNGVFDVANGTTDLADVDNYPLGNFPGPEDVDNYNPGTLDIGDALQVTYTDSWDDNLPTGCTKDFTVLNAPVFDVDALPKGDFPGPGDTDIDGDGVFDAPLEINGVELDCYDGLRAFNQMRPAVFDGGYAFTGLANDFDDPTDATFPAGPNDIDYNGDGILNDNGELGPGFYIVETVTPPGYELMKEEDKNVDFGADFIPTPAALPQVCVGDDHIVQQYLSLQTDSDGNLLPGILPVDAVESPLSLETVKLCDRKGVHLSARQNAAADFWLLTKAPIAAQGKGFILNDLANEFDPVNPQFGEKYAPPFIPIAIRDWNGREVERVYGDEYGNYNLPIPSTFNANVPNPSGFGPGMFFVCMNDLGPIPNPDFGVVAGAPEFIPDPAHQKQYSQFCYPLQFMPGSTTYLDTPVVPVAAFTGPGQFPLDCECEDGIPAIAEVNGPGASGPWIPRTASAVDITISSLGSTQVPNPAYEGADSGTAIMVARDYGFGVTPGTVTLTRGTDVTTISPSAANWADGEITATVPISITNASNNREWQLMVTRGDNGNTTKVGITFTVRNPGSAGNLRVHHVFPDTANFAATPIQDKMDDPDVANGELIIIHPGLYTENVIMHKAVKLQCTGAGSTFINVPSLVGARRVAWLDKVEALALVGAYDLLPGQIASREADGIEAGLGTEAGAGILVLSNEGDARRRNRLRIDGCSITGADNGGGIVINGFSRDMTISNNRISNNYGILAGGIRFGNPTLIDESSSGILTHADARNDDARIHHNMVTQNGSAEFGGGGVGLFAGTDRYQVTDNFICGNFTQGHGGGITHLGFSGGRAGNRVRLAQNRIVDNTIIFNQSFNQDKTRHGGGIFIGGQPSMNLLANPGALSRGSGSVLVDSNLIQGNLAATGEGGGIRLDTVNGEDQGSRTARNRIDIINNRIVNNVAGLAGGGISLFDATEVDIVHNTIANNDSTATHGSIFNFTLNESVPQPAGIISHALSAGLDAAESRASEKSFSNPRMIDNIIFHNRSFKVVLDDVNFDSPRLVLFPDVTVSPPNYDDLAVVGTGVPTDVLHPESSILSTENGLNDYDSFGAIANAGAYGAFADNNQAVDPDFVNEYSTGSGATVVIPEVTTNIVIQGAFDEGGNFIDMQLGPLTINAVPSAAALAPDYHIDSGSPAVDAGVTLGGLSAIFGLGSDFDDEPRPAAGGPDIGADETQPAPIVILDVAPARRGRGGRR